MSLSTLRRRSQNLAEAIMVRKKVDPKVRSLIENSVKLRQRGLIVLVGDHGKDQVVNLHLMLSKTQVKARPSVLWCYKKELELSRCEQIDAEHLNLAHIDGNLQNASTHWSEA